ncbi:MAG TPA: PHP domain-containing protein [Candidatus Limnocylindrales bacterium]|nr:PHP domain-containing protein [Candidatus Limnocylindrales bacterium]
MPPAPATVDLHSHTLRSDGILTPQELADAAAAVGVRLLAITDHDTLAGVRELRASGSTPAGLEILPGIEINTVVADRDHIAEGEVHVLGLGVDPDDDALEGALARQRDARRARFEKMVTKLRELGMSIDDALGQLPATTDEDALGRPRIARALILTGHAESVEDAFNRHLSRGRPAYVPREGLGPRQAIGAIRAAGGIASLAHYPEAPANMTFLRGLVELGLNGLEVHYRAYDVSTVRLMQKIASDLRLLPTGGTDYHGDRETYAEAHAQLWNPPEIESGIRQALGAAPASA